MNRRWLYYISPCILASVFCAIGIFSGFANMGRSQGWSFIGVIILVPVLAILLVTDFAVKVLTKGNLRYIWIIEVVIVIIMILLLKYKIF